ncbi:nuclear speckle splicing regulatory protein 1-like [Varroa jacobsoni]|uniref:nuclear speckle splicing regulatory protein 1-like n=1 Tax=Varroa jacobsoni TaxID=62625 RepID=UPI000BF9EFC2|nr:nuclear speckle splicing regulatory protein 1-like [Varroa jacobsoni]
MNMASPRKYGLILPKSKQSGSIAALQKAAPSNVFGDESDDEHDKRTIEDTIKKASVKSLAKVQTQMMMKRALDEDANVFEYDEVYDEMKSKKEAEDIANKAVIKDRKPRYIESLIRNAEARKKEEERRAQRKIQKEREDEKEDFGDKEAFVTAAYKKKIEQMQQEEEEAKRKEQLEEMMDVTKQKDLSGFYRHLLKQQCGEEKIPDRSTSETSLIKDTKNTSLKQSFGEHSTEHGTSSQTNIARVTEPALKTRGQSNDDDHDNNNNNPDADSEFFETSSGEDDAQRKSDVQTITVSCTKMRNKSRTYRKRKHTSELKNERENTAKQNDSDDTDDDNKSSSQSDSDRNDDNVKRQTVAKKPIRHLQKDIHSGVQVSEPQCRNRAPKDWREMFEKRCVGDKFEAAKQRYLARKAACQGATIQ